MGEEEGEGEAGEGEAGEGEGEEGEGEEGEVGEVEVLFSLCGRVGLRIHKSLFPRKFYSKKPLILNFTNFKLILLKYSR